MSFHDRILISLVICHYPRRTQQSSNSSAILHFLWEDGNPNDVLCLGQSPSGTIAIWSRDDPGRALHEHTVFLANQRLINTRAPRILVNSGLFTSELFNLFEFNRAVMAHFWSIWDQTRPYAAICCLIYEDINDYVLSYGLKGATRRKPSQPLMSLFKLVRNTWANASPCRTPFIKRTQSDLWSAPDGQTCQPGVDPINQQMSTNEQVMYLIAFRLAEEVTCERSQHFNDNLERIIYFRKYIHIWFCHTEIDCCKMDTKRSTHSLNQSDFNVSLAEVES